MPWFSALVFRIRQVLSTLREAITLRTLTGEMIRLNDSIESWLEHEGVRRYSRAERMGPRVPVEFYETDESKDAYEEWRREFEQTRSAANVDWEQEFEPPLDPHEVLRAVTASKPTSATPWPEYTDPSSTDLPASAIPIFRKDEDF